MSKINPPDSTYDVVSEEIMERAYIHSCGNSVDAESLKLGFKCVTKNNNLEPACAVMWS